MFSRPNGGFRLAENANLCVIRTGQHKCIGNVITRNKYLGVRRFFLLANSTQLVKVASPTKIKIIGLTV